MCITALCYFYFIFLLLNDHFTYKCAFHFHNVSTKSTVWFVNSQYLVTKPKLSRMDLYFVWAYFIHITNRAKEFIKTKMGNRLLSFRQNMLKLLTDIGIATVHFDTTIKVQPFFCGFVWHSFDSSPQIKVQQKQWTSCFHNTNCFTDWRKLSKRNIMCTR